MPYYKTPTKSQIDTAVQRMRSPEFAAYFFARLQNPKWIAPLSDAGLFAHPPPTMQYWPASNYLMRMAPQAPKDVANQLAQIETQNPWVIGDIVKAALATPVEVAMLLVPVICRAAREGSLWIYLKDASDLCIALAKANHADAAIALAEALFRPTFENRGEEPARRDEYWYKKCLEQVVPVLAEYKPPESLSMLCDWVSLSVEAKHAVDAGANYSYLWRAAIEEHEQNRDYDFAGAMVGFVREGFEKAVHAGGMRLTQALEIVARFSHIIFQRLRIHLIGEFANQNIELARQTIMDHNLLDDLDCMHEYSRLVERRLDLLTAEQQTEWFGWIYAGPDMSDFDQNPPKPTEEYRQAWIEDWQLEKLHWVRAYLAGPSRELYDSLVSRHGQPAAADMVVRISSGVIGDESPMSVEELAAMTFDEAVDQVSKWRPQADRHSGPSITGLASVFEQYVAKSPTEDSAKALILINLPAIFIRAFISQITQAVKAGKEIELTSMIELCEWVVKRPVDEPSSLRRWAEGRVDEGWQWTRDEIARFIHEVCAAQNDGKPRFPMDRFRQRIWQLIEPLCRDRAESNVIRDTSQDDPRVHDYLQLAINSPRGKGVEAGLEFARWVANHIKEFDGKQEIVPSGFEAIPEVRQMLEWQIASENRSLEALSMIGSRIGLMYWIDKQWLENNANRLFSLEDTDRDGAAAHGWAAWNAFLVWNRPHIEFYRIFKSQFAYAVKRTVDVNEIERGREQPLFHLGEHLMLLYGRGQLDLDDDRGFLREFIENGCAEVRQHAISFVGLSLEREEGIPEEIIQRFQKLWDFYWPEPGKKDAEHSAKEDLFGAWFASGRFPAHWALDRLQQFIEVNPNPQPDYEIPPKLAEIAHVDLVKSVRMLDRILRANREGWRLQNWMDSAKQILSMAMSAPGEAHDCAKKLIDYLGRRGYNELGELLR
jgi:hypothetical protein